MGIAIMQGLLIGIIIVLFIVLLYMKKDAILSWFTPAASFVQDQETMTVPRGFMGHPYGCRCSQCTGVNENDAKALKTLHENQEFFAACKDSANPLLNLNCSGDDSGINYAVSEFGAPGLDYSDWVKAQGVDPEVQKNHAEFIKERQGGAGVQGAITTGRTYSPDSNDSYNPYPWIGIRGRPQAVAVCNPTQMPDTDFDLYPVKSKMSWSSV
jgi:hypothetical protein